MSAITEVQKISLRKHLKKYEKTGVSLFLNGAPSNTDKIMKQCFREDAQFMGDYIIDEQGRVIEIHMNRVSVY